MKKQSFITILLTVLMSMIGAKAFAYDFAVANSDGVTIYYEWANEEKTELSVSYTHYTSVNHYYSDYSGIVVIPESITYEGNNYLVTSIGSYAFQDCGELTSVTIPNSVTSIGESAFKNCSSLTSIIIPNSVTSIGYQAFLGCSSLSSIIIPNSVTSIGSSAFNGCIAITSITIPNSVTSIGNWAFQDCSSLTSVTIPNSVTEIGEFAFSGCKQLSQMIFPESLKYLEIGVCYNCENLSSISLPPCIEGIGRSAFAGCKSLEEFVIPDSVKEISYMAFKNCSGLKRLYWGKSIEKVSGDLFTGCNSLYEVFISDLSKWCETEFSSELANPLYKVGIVDYGTKLFLNNEIVDTLFVPTDVDIIRKYAFYGYTWLESIKFPESNIKVEDNAFSNCRQLNSVYFGGSTIELGNQVFNQCEDIQYVVSQSREPYMFWDWTFYKPIYNKCTLYVPKGTKEAYSSTDGWKNFTKIIETDVDDPALKISVRVSGEGEVSINKTNVDENDITIALYDTDVTFSFKPKLGFQIKSFLVNGEELAQSVIDNSYILTRIQKDTYIDIIFDEIQLVDGLRFHENSIYYIVKETPEGFCLEVTSKNDNYLGNIIIPNYVVFHGDTIFVETIGEKAFRNCEWLYSVEIPSTIRTIGESAFYGCTSLKTILIPPFVDTIGKAAFSGCNNLTNIYCLNNVPPSYNNYFVGINVNKCTLWVPEGSYGAYKGAIGWKNFKTIKKLFDGDVNLDRYVDKADINTLTSYIMDKAPSALKEYISDLNKDGKINIADIVKLIDIINKKNM